MRPYEILPLTVASASAAVIGSSSNSSNSSNSSSSSSMLRSESLAYPPATRKTFLARISYCLRTHSHAVLATLAFVAFLLVISSDLFHDNFSVAGNLRANNNAFGGAVRRGYFSAKDAIIDDYTFRFAAVTDLDQLSRIKESDKPEFKSILLPGTIHRNPDTNQYTISFDDNTRTLTTKHNEAGRGAEFSELIIYQNRLLTMDDRTGSVFEILNKPDGQESFVVPRFVIPEGDGDTDKGMKWEWSTIKNNELYLGSMGKEYTNSKGVRVNTNNLWITIINSRGEMRKLDWTAKYDFVREKLGASGPGYVIHEAVNWSPALQKWVFLPRRISADQYDEFQDERMGSNKLVMVDDKFTTAKVVDIKISADDHLHGFSTFAFVPNSNDRHALAIRSVEEDCVGGEESKCKQRSYFMIFDVETGDVLCDEIKYREDLKFEGVEFVNIATVPPPMRRRIL